MTPGETTARLALADMMAIAQRNGSVLQRFQAIEDRLFQAQRDLEAALERVAATPPQLVPVPDCTCGEPDCKRGVCR